MVHALFFVICNTDAKCNLFTVRPLINLKTLLMIFHYIKLRHIA